MVHTSPLGCGTIYFHFYLIWEVDSEVPDLIAVEILSHYVFLFVPVCAETGKGTCSSLRTAALNFSQQNLFSQPLNCYESFLYVFICSFVNQMGCYRTLQGYYDRLCLAVGGLSNFDIVDIFLDKQGSKQKLLNK